MQSLQTEHEIKEQKIDYIINGMFLNQNNTLLSLATNKGYKIFESFNLKQVSEDDEIIELIGDLKIAIPFYESNLIHFVGSDKNLSFPSTQMIAWDDNKKKKLGLIILKDKIYSLKIQKEAIYIQVFNKILIFDLKNMNYLFSISDVNCFSSDHFVLNSDINPIVLGYQPSSKMNQIKFIKSIFLFNYLVTLLNEEISGKIHFALSMPFKIITKYNFYKGKIAIIIGDNVNKIHIYSLDDFGLKFCLDSSHPFNKILNISISKKNKFFSVLYEDYNLEIYNLQEEKKINSNCECINSLIENKKESQKTSYFSRKFLNSALGKVKVNLISFYFRLFLNNKIKKVMLNINLILSLNMIILLMLNFSNCKMRRNLLL